MLELFGILILAGIILCLAGFWSKMGPIVIVSGFIFLIVSIMVFTTGLNLEAGTHKYIPTGALDQNVVDYNVTYALHSVSNDNAVNFLFWFLFAWGLFFVIFGTYVTATG
jgi:hypothetical protein